MWETLLSLHLLQTRDGARIFTPWRRCVRSAPHASLRRLLTLAPPRGYSPDFLTPNLATTELAEGIEVLSSTARPRLRGDLEVLARTRRLPAWAVDLAEGRTFAVRQLGEDLRYYHGHALTPHWESIRAHVEADRALRARALLKGGVERLLSTLNPALRWLPPVLELRGPLIDRDLHLDGRGLRLVPSFFCWRTPIVLRDPELPPVLVYPIDHDSAERDWLTHPRQRQETTSLTAVLGRTRAAVLRTVTERGRSTTLVARDVGVSAATASQHLSALRKAGLITTHRSGQSTHHAATPLGCTLCGPAATGR